MKHLNIVVAVMAILITACLSVFAAGGGADYGRGPETDPVAIIPATNAQTRVAAMEAASTNRYTKAEANAAFATAAQGTAATNAQTRVAAFESTNIVTTLTATNVTLMFNGAGVLVGHSP